MSATSMAVEIFCSYTPEDKDWLDKLEIHLSLLKRQKLLSLWHNRLVAPGADWATAIDIHLETASVILLLVSADFFASEYCFGIEMPTGCATRYTYCSSRFAGSFGALTWVEQRQKYLNLVETGKRTLMLTSCCVKTC